MTNKELLEIINKTYVDKSTYLNLSNMNLTSIPTSIEKLTHLRRLDLDGNQLQELPAEIGALVNLDRLCLYKNQLNSLPFEIINLVSLKELNLNHNKLKTLPAAIGKLVKLKELYLRNNHLITLPAEIGSLANLNVLSLNYNRLTSLPAEIGRLIGLRELGIGGNQLTSLPSATSQLTNLKELYLNNNQLQDLRADIGRLTSLNSIDLSGNRISKLTVEIGKLTNLITLDLHDNQLVSLPAEIGKLTKLITFDLYNNQLVSLPAEIGKLNNLKELYLNGNPSLSLPPEIRGTAVSEIINFYRQQLEQKTDRIFEAKLLLIGESGAGKTTLAKKIQSSDYQLKEEDSTQGINVIRWQFPLSNGKEFRVNIWDFGGQEIYHTTHQFFLTKRSLYTLVIDTRKEDTDFYYWLNVVELLSEKSPLLIIKNEKQDRKREINEKQLRGEFDNLKESLSTNLSDNRGLSEILEHVKYYISNLTHVGTELPKTWVKVRHALEEDFRNYISLEEYLYICEENGFTRREDKFQLSGYLHDLGVCLHFQEDDVLVKTVILKPTWGTDAVYKVLDNSQVINNQGRFTRDDLNAIWCDEKYIDMQPELLRLMMNFKLCYEIPNSPKTYIAPQWLTPNQPDYNWDESANLLLRYEYEFMPKGILTRFIVEMHNWIERQSCVWKNGVILEKDDARAEVIELYRYHKGEIRIRVSGQRPRDLLANIRHELDKIHDSYNSQDDRLNKIQRLKYQTLVPCNCSICETSQTPHFYQLNNLHNFKKKNIPNIQCQTSGEMVAVNGLIDDVDFGIVTVRSGSKSYSENLKRTFKSEIDLRIEKLNELRKEFAIETDSNILFKLEKNIEAEENKIAAIGNRLDEMR
jgi:internalin A